MMKSKKQLMVYVVWCKDNNEMKNLPADLLMLHFVDTSFWRPRTKKVLTTAIYGIRWSHHINGFLLLLYLLFVDMAFEGGLVSYFKVVE